MGVKLCICILVHAPNKITVSFLCKVAKKGRVKMGLCHVINTGRKFNWKTRPFWDCDGSHCLGQTADTVCLFKIEHVILTTEVKSVEGCKNPDLERLELIDVMSWSSLFGSR